MTIGIRYISRGDNSGYGLAALAYVRALHNLGVPVSWEPWLLDPQAAPWRPESGLAALPLAHAATRDNDSSDVPALIAATTRRRCADARKFQTITSCSTAWVRGIRARTWPG